MWIVPCSRGSDRFPWFPATIRTGGEDFFLDKNYLIVIRLPPAPSTFYFKTNLTYIAIHIYAQTTAPSS